MNNLLKHGWKITVPIVIVVIFDMGLSLIALHQENDIEHLFGLEITPDGFKLKNQLTTKQAK